MAKKLLVTGAAGFIGAAVCRRALAEGHTVVALAHHGRPAQAGAWADAVTWVAADVLSPDDWRAHLAMCDGVIHCVGILRERPGATFERINGDAAETVAWEAEHAGVEHFVFLSAAVKPLFVDDAYLKAKRRAEASLRGRKVRETILRPAFVYGPGRPATLPAGALRMLGRLPGLGSWAGRLRPLHVDQVAAAAVWAATEPGYEGVLTPDDIAYVAGVATRGAETPEVRPRTGWPLRSTGIAAGAAAGLAVGLWAWRTR